MFSAMLLTISVVALSQFALYYWRAVLAGVAAQPVSGRVFEAARVQSGELSGGDFHILAGLHDLTPDLRPSAGGWMPFIAEWAERERMICARYAAVQIDRRMQANLALAAAIRSC